MPNFTATTTITIGRGETITATKSSNYEDVFSIRQECTNDNAFINLILGGAKSQGTLEECKFLLVKNASDVGAEIQIHTFEWTNATPDTNAGTSSYQLTLLGAGDYMVLPNFRQLNFQAVDGSGGDAYQLTNQAPDSNMYVAVNNPAAGDAQLLDEGSNITNSVTNFTVDDGNFFKAGDLIRIDNEIMEVTSVSTNELYVIRGTHGSAKATHNDDAALRFPFFNAYADFDKYSTAQTDASGRFKAMNFFGYARTEGEADGLVPGSISGKFYKAGYQELGMSGITPSTATGLAASTAYAFDIACDGGSDHTLSFTTDSSNGNFGGTNGLLSKIQDALDTQFYTTSSNLLNKKVIVSIVNGDIRFTSGQHLSTSAIAISAPASGTTPFGVGAFSMAVGDIEGAVAARLPVDEIVDRKSNINIPNKAEMFYDDGFGNIQGVCSGTINYETGAIDLLGCPPNANFVVDANYGSAHSGGNNFTATTANCIVGVAARSCNSKLNTVIEVIGLK
tara:strand:+ start:190 stop:1710 length:1521 start_codon:yes stop_codon:yes gene_type:complete